MSPRQVLLFGTLWAALGVTLGAFGAHWLEGQLPLWYGQDLPLIERQRHTWEVGVRYQLIHALGLLLLGLWSSQSPRRSVTLPALLLICGSVIFSGCLYALVLTGQRKLGAVVPIGGGLMILGWLCWSWQLWQESPAGVHEQHTPDAKCPE
jgi:uncharacterized membrane protein YgdD (TMEM256/DUF423 family)